MRIGMVITQFPPNVTAGLGRYAEQIWPLLAEDADLSVFTLGTAGSPVEERVGPAAVFRPSDPILRALARVPPDRTTRAGFGALVARVMLSNIRYAVRLARTLRERRPDLVAVHDSTNAVCGLLAHHRLGIPVVLHVHTTEYTLAPRRTRRAVGAFTELERRLARIAARIVVATPEVREQLVDAGWDAARITVVPLGGTFERELADPAFRREGVDDAARRLRADLGIDPGDPVIGFVGRIEAPKGIDQLLSAFAGIAAEDPRPRLVLLGEGDAEGVRRKVEENGLAGRVIHLTRFVGGSDLMAHFAMADVCVFPSLFEPFGLVAVEAMSLGRPVILGDGFSRLFEGDRDDPAALFVDSTDPSEIAGAITALLDDPDRADRLARAGERLVRERFSWVRTATATLEIYRTVLDERDAVVTRPRR